MMTPIFGAFPTSRLDLKILTTKYGKVNHMPDLGPNLNNSLDMIKIPGTILSHSPYILMEYGLHMLVWWKTGVFSTMFYCNFYRKICLEFKSEPSQNGENYEKNIFQNGGHP